MKWFIAVGGLVALARCTSTPVPAPDDTFQVAHPRRADTFFEKEYVGQVQALQRVELRARTRGVIEAVGVDEGQAVKAGQVLFTLNARALQQDVKRAKAQVESAAADLKAAELERRNLGPLFEAKVVSTAELELADAKVGAFAAKLEEAKANESQAALNLTYAQVRAPFDGVVNRLQRKVGSVVAEDELLTTLTDTSEVLVYFRVSEREYLDYLASKGASRPAAVSLRLANGVTYPASGVIDAIETEFDDDTGNIAFRARFPNAQQLLKHRATGKVVLRYDLSDAVTVPQRSTFEIQEQLFVFTVDSANIARARRITPKLRLSDTFVVESGLGPEDRFIVEGAQKLKDGDRIVARVEALPASPAL